MTPVGKTIDHISQHVGFGTKLMHSAETIAYQNGYTKISVIAGIGTRDYYMKLGYHLENTYMVKYLNFYNCYIYYYIFPYIKWLKKFYNQYWKKIDATDNENNQTINNQIMILLFSSKTAVASFDQ